MIWRLQRLHSHEGIWEHRRGRKFLIETVICIVLVVLIVVIGYMPPATCSPGRPSLD